MTKANTNQAGRIFAKKLDQSVDRLSVKLKKKEARLSQSYGVLLLRLHRRSISRLQPQPWPIWIGPCDRWWRFRDGPASTCRGTIREGVRALFGRSFRSPWPVS